ncbi:MAG: hypothetical protein GQ529_11105 [Methyloprofundus sp.]|nr:hypothetical protein [Methyloprofundus sp.]
MKSLSQLRLYIASIILGLFFICSPAISLADTYPNLDTKTAILDMSLVSVDKKEWYKNVQLKLNFDTGQFELLSAEAADNNAGLTSNDFCVDNYPQLACTELGKVDGGGSQFVLASSCSSSFPQQIYLAEASTGEFCASLGNCGACALSVGDNARTGKNTDNAGSIDIEGIINDAILNSTK